jgi:hypothetical protein
MEMNESWLLPNRSEFKISDIIIQYSSTWKADL